MGHTLRTLVKWFHGSKRFNFTGSWSALYLIGDASRVGYFVPLNGPLNGHPPSIYYNSPYVCISVSRRSQTAGRNSCSIVSGDVSNCSYRRTVHPLTSSRVSSAKHFFICENPSKPRGNMAACASVYFKGQRPAIVTSGAGRHGWLASNSDTATAVCSLCVWGCAGVRAAACVRAGACARVCVRPFVLACVRPFVCACVRCLPYTIILFDTG